MLTIEPGWRTATDALHFWSHARISRLWPENGDIIVVPLTRGSSAGKRSGKMWRPKILLTLAMLAFSVQGASQDFMSDVWLADVLSERGALVASSPPLMPAPSPAAFGSVEPPTESPFLESPGAQALRVEASWSARIDYFHWNERLDGEDFVNERGPVVTLCYVRRIGPERFRAGLFGGSVGYGADYEYGNGTSEYLSSHTNYLGLRGEYDLVYDPARWPEISLFAGLGTRFWFRDLPDDETASGMTIWGYRETWWTIYPYLGLETRGDPELRDVEFFGAARIGSTAFTYEHVTWNDISLYPRAGLAGQLELGLRGPRLFLSAQFEAMTWADSHVVRNSFQPRSRMLTVGLNTGFRF